MDRRTFLKTSAAGGALIAVGCGNPVNAAPLVEALVSNNFTTVREATINNTPMSAGYGTIKLRVPFYRDLDKIGGAITIHLPVDANDQNRAYELPPGNTILVVQRSALEFAAFQSSCPHAACPLGYSLKDDRIECPCHSSRFLAADVDKMNCAGQVTHAPAQSSLTTWDVQYEVATQVLTIDLNSPRACNNTFPPLVSGTLTLPLSDFPQLAMAGGSATGQPMGVVDPIIVVRVDANTVAALDAKCTHRGCTVLWAPSRKDLECPCHGSAFATDGRVLSAPATTPLKSYAATINASAIVVTIV
jgi:cytochrome b6-f complex iron-sulfur subunit